MIRIPPLHGLRFAFGTLTVLPVPVTRWDRVAARAGMLCAPLAGVVVGGIAGLLGAAALVAGAGPLLAAVCAAAVPAVLTRGLHLDGLADTADGLGSGKPAAEALRIMKQSDIGPFGVITLVLVLLAQVAALAEAYGGSWERGALAAAVSATAARLALTLAGAAGYRPPGRRDWGRGGRRVPVRGALAVAVAAAAAAAAARALSATYGAVRAAAARWWSPRPPRIAAAALRPPLRRGHGRCVRRPRGDRGDGRAGGAVARLTPVVRIGPAGRDCAFGRRSHDPNSGPEAARGRRR